MTLEAQHYVPILRWKLAEQNALGQLHDRDRKNVTPLIEMTLRPFLPRVSEEAEEEDDQREPVISDVSSQHQIWGTNDLTQSPDPADVLRKQAKQILRHWRNSSFFIDLQNLEGRIELSDKRHALAHFLGASRDFCLSPIPVVGISRSKQYLSAVSESIKADRRGACIRVTANEALQANFVAGVERLLKRLAIQPKDLDLLLDVEVYDQDTPDLQVLIANIPKLLEWRSFVLGGGAFPKDLQGYEPGTHLIPRRDWTTWRDQTFLKKIRRKPAFSDYAIQYGRYVEPVKGANPSASIRYALDESWLLMRGEGIFNEDGPGAEQWTSNAILLCERKEFLGENFSSGDKYIYEMSQKDDTHGNPRTWLQAGLNHHLTLTSRQIAAL